MAERRPKENPTRRERRQAGREGEKARQTVAAASPLTVATSYARQDVLAFLVLGLLVVVPYLPAMLWGGFVWDDFVYIKADPVREVSGLWQIWLSPSAIENEGHYWPLVYTTFWLEHKLWGFDPTGYHIVNVLLHLANTLLLWHLLRRLAVPGAWMVAAVFAVHPLHVESVAWVIERKDVLSGLFYLAAVLAWMRFVEKPSRGRYAGSLVLYAAGMLSKSIVVTLPATLLIWRWWKQGRVTAPAFKQLVPFFIVGLAFALGDLSFHQSTGGISFDFSLTERSLIAARALWFYAGKLLWPTNLAVIYPLWDIRPAGLGYLIAAVALALALWHYRSRIGRAPLAGALFFAVTLSPVLGFVDHGYMRYAFVADRYQYLAGIGVMVVVIGAVACGVRSLSGLWQKGALGVAAVALVALGMLTWRQAALYQDDETFFRHIIKHNPQARNAYSHLGYALYLQERVEEAVDAARVAVQQRPDHAKAHAVLGMALKEVGRLEEAGYHSRRAVELNYDQYRYSDMLTVAQQLVALDSSDAAAHNNMGIALALLGRHGEALHSFDQALSLDPELENARLNRAEVLEAIQQAEQAGE